MIRHSLSWLGCLALLLGAQVAHAIDGGAGTTFRNGVIASASSETDFLTSGALTCGAGTQGKIQVHTTPLQYCDNAATPALQYSAYGTSSGDATGLVCTTCVGTTDIAANAVTNIELNDVATMTFKGRVLAGTGSPTDLSMSTATSMLNLFASGTQGVVPASGGLATVLLHGDGMWDQVDLSTEVTGVLPLANLTDDGTGGLCLKSGGAGGDPAYGSCSTGAGIAVIKEDNSSVVAAADTLDFTEPDATIVTESPTNEGNVDLSQYVLLAGRASTPQTIHGGPDASDTLTLKGTSDTTPDTATGFLQGSSILLNGTGQPVPIYLSRGDFVVHGTFSQLMFNDGKTPGPEPGEDTSTITLDAATCTASAAMNADCDAANSPWACCTGATTGNCGYCDGTGSIPIACDTTAVGTTCDPSFLYMSHWWNVLDFAHDGIPVEGAVGFVFGPTITGSGGGTRNTGATGLIDYIPIYQIPNGTNLATSSHGVLYSPQFTRPTGTSTGTAGIVYGLALGGSVSAGWTIDDWVGVQLNNPTNAGTITDIGAVSIPADITAGAAGGETFAIRSAIEAGTNKWFLKSTGEAKSNIAGKVRLADDTTAPTAQLEVTSPAGTKALRGNISGSITGTDYVMQFGGDGIAVSGTNAQINPFSVEPVITVTGTTNAFGAGNMITAAEKWQTDGSAATIASPGAIVASQTYDANGAALTINSTAIIGVAAPGIVSTHAFNRSSGTSTQTVDGVTNFLSGAVFSLINVLGSGWTTPYWDGLKYIEPINNGTITYQAGIEIPSLSVGSDDYPILIGENTIDASAVPANYGVLGIETGAPGVFYVVSEDESVRRLRGTSPATQRLGSLKFDMGSGNTITTSDEWVFRLNPFAATMTSITCEAYAGTSFTIKVCQGEDTGNDTCTTNHLSATETDTLVCNTTGASDSTLNSTTIAANDKVTIVVTAVSGTVQMGEIIIDGTAS